ncbi:hypothetical protein ALP36_02001 [Pseudomonas syringae pv. coriandricola]|uniref:Uncharacterized protein n=1 Tax=Pseudomonas syringae pv. coriandricola TaxID=264453 RepID=A0A3M5RGT9_9PSED|nr:hypothetical protein [Pseudomonas syringae group genomosp. 3]RMR37939.1 hypothetical protein ALP87_03387 [Pseudomonas syringae pv. coriandricola]RMU08272.1 hypothetical protein ALP36_02001 [Pseudomonas syringae pv. coriandricola]
MNNVVAVSRRYNGQAQETERLKESLKHLVVVALISAVFSVVAITISNADTPHPDLFALLMSISLLLGIYTFMALMELRLGQRLLQWKSTVVLWVVFFGCLSYFAKIQAVSDINSIFHIDASLFPMTVLATTALHSVGMLFWVVVFIGGISFLFALTTHRPENEIGQTLIIILCHAVNAFTFLVISLFIAYKVHDENSRRQMIYRIAQVADFNSFSPCKNVDAKLYSSLYIDANRYMVLVAPKIIDAFNLEARRFSVFRSVKVPESFPVLRCVY